MAQHSNRRRHLRFPPEPEWAAAIEVQGKRVPALIINESKSGCQLVLAHPGHEFGPSSSLRVTLGTLAPLEGRVCWQDAQQDMIRIGIEFRS